MSKSEIINVYQEGIQSIVTLVQELSNQISDLSQSVKKQNNIIFDLNTRLKKLASKNTSLPPSTDGFKKNEEFTATFNSSTWRSSGSYGHNIKKG